jgi:hypothetical protein
MMRAMAERALLFLHLPKTAGTTLNRILEWQYNPLSIFTIDPYRIRATAERLAQLSESRRRRIRVIRGHFYYGLHDILPQGGTYITILRDPVARLFSSYYFVQRRPLHPLHRKVKGGRISVEDFIRLTLHRQNLQCRMIAGIKGGEEIDERALEKAKRHLADTFSVVGISDRFEESLMLMAATFGWEVPFYESRKVAKSRPKRDPETVEMIRKHNRLDLELYEFGKSLLDAGLKQRKSEVEERLARLRRSPRPGPVETFYNSSIGAGRFLVSKIASAI